MYWRKSQASDVEGIKLQSAQLDGIDADAEIIAEIKNAQTGFDDAGNPVAILGSQEIWSGRMLGWAFLAENAGPYMTPITRKALDIINEADYHRFEMHVAAGFVAGERWAEMLGFHKEAVLARFFPNGSDASMWSLINDGQL